MTPAALRRIPALVAALVFLAASTVPCGLPGESAEAGTFYIQSHCPCGCGYLPSASGASNGFDPVVRACTPLEPPALLELVLPEAPHLFASLPREPQEPIPIRV